MNNQEIRETLREMLVHWNVCMEIAMRDAGASEEEAKEMVGKMFTALVKPSHEGVLGIHKPD